MKRLGILGMMLVTVLSVFPQTKKVAVTGKIIDSETKEAVMMANVRLLLLPDSTYVTGAASNEKGIFTLSPTKAGKYALKVSYVGFKDKVLALNLDGSSATHDVGTVSLKTDSKLMAEVVISAEAAQVQVVEDTLVFNTSAYRTPDGAMLEELVKKFPGAEVDDNGNITINGKQVKKIMVNGKEFFGGDVQTGMKNLPVEMIEKVKAYDKQSDLARVTGIDDGEEETVLDLTVKKGMNQGMFGNFDVAAGTEDRYSLRGMMNYFRENTQVSAIGGANNVNNQGMSGGGGGPRFRGGNGQTTTKTLGASFATETDKLQLGGSIRYNYSKRDAVSKGYTENFLANSSSYSNSNSANLNRSESMNAEFRLEWNPNELTNIIFRPNLTISKSNANSVSQSGTFDDDPYKYTENPNDYLNVDSLMHMPNDPLHDIRLNAANNASLSESKSVSAGATLQINRRLNDRGRNITFLGRTTYGDTDNDSYSESFTRYYKEQQTDTIFRYNTTPSTNYSFSGKLTYSEPIAAHTYLQFGYQLKYSYNESDRRTYGLLNATGGNLWRLNEPLPSDYEDYEDKEQSKYAEYKTLEHDISLSLKYTYDKVQLNAGLSLLPQHTELSYRKNQLDTIVKRNVLNFSPNVNLRIRFSKMSNLQFTYRGSNSQPSMENLLPITDNSNPLNIQVGNPGLEPAFNHNMNFNFRDYNVERQRNIMANASFSVIQNAITNVRTYNEETGGWTNTSDNINGNWSVRAGFGYNTALRNKKFNIGTNTNISFNNNVGYLAVNKLTEKNTTTDLNFTERLTASYRNGWFEIGLNGSLSYSWEKDKLRPENNQEPYTYSYGGNLQITLPWNMTLTTNIGNQCRRGYTDSSMNRNELIWNAQLSQTLFKNASLTFEMYDILKNQSNITRQLTASGRSVYEYNGVNSYCMLHFIYRLNIFGGKDARKNMRNRGGFEGGSRGAFGPRGMGNPNSGARGGRMF